MLSVLSAFKLVCTFRPNVNVFNRYYIFSQEVYKMWFTARIFYKHANDLERHLWHFSPFLLDYWRCFYFDVSFHIYNHEFNKSLILFLIWSFLILRFFILLYTFSWFLKLCFFWNKKYRLCLQLYIWSCIYLE